MYSSVKQTTLAGIFFTVKKDECIYTMGNSCIRVFTRWENLPSN